MKCVKQFKDKTTGECYQIKDEIARTTITELTEAFEEAVPVLNSCANNVGILMYDYNNPTFASSTKAGRVLVHELTDSEKANAVPVGISNEGRLIAVNPSSGASGATVITETMTATALITKIVNNEIKVLSIYSENWIPSTAKNGNTMPSNDRIKSGVNRIFWQYSITPAIKSGGGVSTFSCFRAYHFGFNSETYQQLSIITVYFQWMPSLSAYGGKVYYNTTKLSDNTENNFSDSATPNEFVVSYIPVEVTE